MPGAGKSTAGMLVAKQLARPFVDADVCIQAGTGRTLRDIIDTGGLDAFCDLEGQYVLCLDLTNHVVATGGSVVYRESSMRFLAGHGVIVYLSLPLPAPDQRLADLRTRGVVRPAGMSLADLYAHRSPLYLRWADIVISCELLDHQGVMNMSARALSQCSA